MTDRRLAALVIGLGLMACTEEPDKAERPSPFSREIAPAPAPKPPTLADQLASAKTSYEAVEIARPSMGDSLNDLDPGAITLAVWANQKRMLSVPELNHLPDNSLAEILKDHEPFRGKKLCSSGQVAEIRADRSVSPPLWMGSIVTNSMKVVRFAAMGSSTGIVDGSKAKICGIFTGIQSFQNTMGGVTQAAFVVGRFM